MASNSTPVSPLPSKTASTNGHSSPKTKRSLRVLCFGDSLTAGYTSWGEVHHPYSTALTTVLALAFPSLHIETHVDGCSGDIVHTIPNRVESRFLRRIEPKFLTKGGGTPYDWTIVLGGTNDLAMGTSPQAIYESLRQVWAVPLSKGGRVLACTVPEAWTGSQRAAKATARRNELNALIRGHKQENFFVFDLNAVIPYLSLSDEEQKKYWDDHVHMTPQGYDLMGEKIAGSLVNIIMPPGRLQSNGERAPRKKRLFKDDDKTFDEEDGDDTLLDQGYIVVRRKDLE